jgi:hypothetical protein
VGVVVADLDDPRWSDGSEKHPFKELPEREDFDALLLLWTGQLGLKPKDETVHTYTLIEAW